MTVSQRRPKLTPKQEKTAYETVARRDGVEPDRRGWCVMCRMFRVVQMDHRQNRDPHNTVPSNLQALCVEDHKWKTEYRKDAIDAGLAVPRNIGDLTPADIPARRWIGGRFGTMRLAWVLYDDEGGWLEITDVEAQYRRRKAGIVA